MESPKNTETQEKVNALIDDLTCDDVISCQNARRLLVNIGEMAVPRLIEALSDQREWVRWEAIKALGEIGGPEAVNVLLKALENKRFDIRWLAAEGLIREGKPVAVPLLEELIARPESVWLRQGAHRIFRDLEHTDYQAILHPVSEAIESNDPSVQIPIAAKSALDKLRR